MKIQVVPYNPRWAELYREEKERILSVLGEEAIAIFHIGSTSVPKLWAKPIIDILPIVKDIEKIDKLESGFKALGYEAMGEFGIPGRRYFRKGGDSRTHHLHMFQYDNIGDIERHLALRDYLRATPEAREAYGELKASLAKTCNNDIEAYNDGKDSFVKDLERKSLLWRWQHY